MPTEEDIDTSRAQESLMCSLIFLVTPQWPVDLGRVLILFRAPAITLAFEIQFVACMVSIVITLNDQNPYSNLAVLLHP